MFMQWLRADRVNIPRYKWTRPVHVFTAKSTDGMDLYVEINCSSLGPCRHHSADSVGGGGVGRQPGEHLRHVGPAEPPFPANSAHGADGPERRHLEASRLCGLRTQQGGLQQSRVQNTHKHSCVAVSQRENVPQNLAEILTDDALDHARVPNRTLSLTEHFSAVRFFSFAVH